MNDKKTASPLFIILVIIVAAAMVFLLFGDATHIEDTNGPDDNSLATLTEEELLSKNLTAVGGPNHFIGHVNLPGGWELSSGVKLFSAKFSGVADILWTTYILPSDFELRIPAFAVTEGNVRLMVINNGEIIQEIEPGTDLYVRFDDLTGTTSLRIAGESAAFELYMDEMYYDQFSHD